MVEFVRVNVRPWHPIGGVTDDTVMCDLLLDAILETWGDLTAYGWVRAWERFDQPDTRASGETITRLDHVHWIERYYDEILGHLLPYRDARHEERTSCVSWNSIEVLGPALATLLITGEDPEAMMLACARFGRDADTVCRVAGGLAGVLGGAEAISAEWRETVLTRNTWLDLGPKAARLAAITRRRLERKAAAAKAVLEGAWDPERGHRGLPDGFPY